MKIKDLQPTKQGDHPLLIDDHLPSDLTRHPSVVSTHSYCLELFRDRLTPPTQACLDEAIRQKFEIDLTRSHSQQQVHLALSNAYPHWAKIERALKQAQLDQEEFPEDQIHHLDAIKSTKDEVLRIQDLLQEVQGDSLLVIADRFHTRRSIKTMAKVLNPEIELYWKSVTPPGYKMTREIFPQMTADQMLWGVIKSVRLGFPSLWEDWNKWLV